MACRVVTKMDEYVIKWIDLASEKGVKNIKMPQFSQHYFISDIENLVEDMNISKRTKQAIIQQYAEILIYNGASVLDRQLLAPQVGISFDTETNLPILMYPFFSPLVEEEIIWKLKEREINVLTFQKMQEKANFSLDQYISFMNKLEKLCDELGLNEDDIMLNPSNLGYNPHLGIRVIDYGLLSLS